MYAIRSYYVYTSSTAAKAAEFAGSAYNSSKAGLLGLMRSVAQDAGPHNVTSNAVLPGWVRTEMAELPLVVVNVQRGGPSTGLRNNFV